MQEEFTKLQSEYDSIDTHDEVLLEDYGKVLDKYYRLLGTLQESEEELKEIKAGLSDVKEVMEIYMCYGEEDKEEEATMRIQDFLNLLKHVQPSKKGQDKKVSGKWNKYVHLPIKHRQGLIQN